MTIERILAMHCTCIVTVTETYLYDTNVTYTQGRRNWEAGGAAAPLVFCWEGQGEQKCPLSIKNIYNN